MCGIFGSFSNVPKDLDSRFSVISALMSHRGPDAEGFYLSENKRLALGHRRLSVIDLREVANQPMSTLNGRWTIVYNGEVYNYQEIRDELLSAGVGPFYTDSDTEVLLLAWVHWGPAAVNKFNGMFAFAIWDQKEEELWLCRDRLGIKPLYYSQQEGINFASEIKGLLPLLSRPPKVSQSAVKSFLHLGFIPEPETIYQEVKKFPAGHHARIGNDNRLELTCYWSPDKQITNTQAYSESQAIEAVENLITSSVKYRMISDVPFGTFLSGGTDSSLVTAVASKMASQRLKTFSIGFIETKFDESKYAGAVAKHLNTDHTGYILSEKDAIPMLNEMLATFDEPFADTSAIPTMMVSQLARSKVKVILTGDGGDELFMGYGAYNWAKRLNNPMVSASMPLIKVLLEQGPSRYKRIAHLFEKEGLVSPRDHIFSQEQYFFSNAELKTLLTGSNEDGFYTYSDTQHIRSLSAAENQALFDLKVYLKDDLLTKVDRSSMRYGLECRVPLLDYRLVQTALNLPEKYKIQNGERKWVLKKALEKFLPKELIYRPKWGFSVPLARWLKGELRFMIDEYLDENVVGETGIVDPSYVSDLIVRFNRGEEYLYNRIWALIVLHKFLHNRQSGE
jgi:asparagine synthase (glutamine-hydrolysing)